MTERPVRRWPPGASEPFEHVETRCPACDQIWHVDVSLCGHRLRCDCGGWIDVPRRGGPHALAPWAAAEPPARATDRVDVVRGYREPPAPSDVVLDVPTNMPMEDGTLRHANVRTRQRWTNRLVLELVAIVAAFWIPRLLIFFLAGDEAALLYSPLANLASGLVVLLIAAGASHYGFGGLRPAPARAYLEALAVAAAFVLLVEAWFGFLRHLGVRFGPDEILALRRTLGWGWAFAVVAIGPAIFEELAFRGLVQGRLAALHGRNGAIVITGTVFGLAHGVTLGLPFHVFGGFYLCWLRARSNSLYPGMCMHLAYNGTLLLLCGRA